VIVPLFALANAGIHIDGSLLATRSARRSRSGSRRLRVGKPLGITGARVVATARSARDRLALSWPVLAGGGAVAGIGFTVVAADREHRLRGRQLEEAKLGVLGRRVARHAARVGGFRVIAHIPDRVAGASCRAPRTTSSTSPRTSIPSATTSAARRTAR
jgi:Na+/H+ antiporter NhaA